MKMNCLHKISITLSFLTISLILQGNLTMNTLWAQNILLKGRAINQINGTPIPFAAVLIFDSSKGTTTDSLGNFLFTDLKPGIIHLQVSSLGYKPHVSQEIQLFQGTLQIEIPLEPDSREIQEINVTVSPLVRPKESPVALQRIGIKWRFVGGAPYTPYDVETSQKRPAWDAQGNGYLDYDQFNTLRLGNFHQLDIRVDKYFFFPKWTLGIYMDVQNVYNKKYIGPDNLVKEEDENGPIIINPDDPYEDQLYKLKFLKNTSGLPLPTIGITARW